MEKLTGICKVTADNVSFRSKEGAEIDLGGLVREIQTADGIVLGFTEKPQPSKVTLTALHSSVTDLIAWRNMTNVTLRFSTDTGKNYTVRGAVMTTTPALTSGSGEVKLEFMGPPADET